MRPALKAATLTRGWHVFRRPVRLSRTRNPVATLPRMPRRAGSLASLTGTTLLALAVLAGCGGGSSPLTESEFISKGDQICKSAHDQFAQAQKSSPTTADEAAALTQKLIGISDSELSQLRGLNPPSEVKPALDRYLSAREQGIAILRQGLAAAQKGDAQAYAAAQAQTAKTQVKRLKLARAVGFEECSRPAGATTTASGG